MPWIHAPQHLDEGNGWYLCLCDAQVIQFQAMKMDPRIIICPLAFDPAPIPDAVYPVYKDHGATATMSMGALLAMLAETEPLYAQQ